MIYTISEKKALKKLGISDFRYMTKDMVVPFLSMAPHMDPEVAKAAIDQFPEFKDMASHMTDVLKDMVNKAFDSEQDSQKFFYDSCNSMLVSLNLQLEDETIDAEERSQIRDEMMQIISWIGQKDTEHKEFVKSMVNTGVKGLGFIAVTALVALGSKLDLPIKNLLQKSEEDSDAEDV